MRGARAVEIALRQRRGPRRERRLGAQDLGRLRLAVRNVRGVRLVEDRSSYDGGYA
jgi:hypothetical protein